MDMSELRQLERNRDTYQTIYLQSINLMGLLCQLKLSVYADFQGHDIGWTFIRYYSRKYL